MWALPVIGKAVQAEKVNLGTKVTNRKAGNQSSVGLSNGSWAKYLTATLEMTHGGQGEHQHQHATDQPGSCVAQCTWKAIRSQDYCFKRSFWITSTCKGCPTRTCTGCHAPGASGTKWGGGLTGILPALHNQLATVQAEQGGKKLPRPQRTELKGVLQWSKDWHPVIHVLLYRLFGTVQGHKNGQLPTTTLYTSQLCTYQPGWYFKYHCFTATAAF